MSDAIQLLRKVRDTVEFIRYRFRANHDDPRPVTFPPPGPFWITGYAGDESHATVVACLPPGVEVRTYWPEATEIDAHERGPIHFTDRFPRPAWWQGAVG